jgi:hypothetical protein
MDNSAFQTSGPKKQPPKLANDSILESLRTLGSGVGKTIAKDVTGQIASDALSSIFGGPNAPQQGEIRPDTGAQVRPERLPFPGFRRPEVRPRAPYVAPEEPHLKEQIEAIRQELKALASSIKNLNSDIQKTVTEVPVDPGIYHKNFFERLRSTLQLLREQVDDSRTWMSLQNGKKQKKGYWGSYKKHGTSFGLSNERSLATQAG